MNILGLDIGYSNLKWAVGQAGHRPHETILPSGAAPEDRLPHGIRIAEEGTTVRVGSEHWRIGLPHGRFDQWTRALHENYSESSGYRALFHGALLISGISHINRLVTGLPVTQWQNAKMRELLAAQLTGCHDISLGRRVVVESVEVIPQPLGAYLDQLWQSGDDARMLSEGRVLIVDPGFYSVDWIVIEGGALRKSGSGSSLDAMSVLIRETVQLISQEHKGQVSAEQVEDALRNQRTDIFLFGELLSLTHYLQMASKRVAHQAIELLRDALRREAGSIDVIILAGGGAPYYRESIQATFAQSRIMMSEDPVQANARGFFYFGEM